MHEHYVESQRLVADLNAFATQGLSAAAIDDAQARFLDASMRSATRRPSLRDTFQELWLRTNLPANLHYAIDEYNAIVKVWDDAAARVRQRKFAYDPRPAAEWIYHPDAFAGQTVQHAYFRKVLKLDPRKIASAGIQVQGDTHVKIYVNGTQIGEQFARRNLSAPVNPKLLAVYDIKPLLKQGENVIAIDARDYGTLNPELEPGGPDRSGGFHLYGEIRRQPAETCSRSLPTPVGKSAAARSPTGTGPARRPRLALGPGGSQTDGLGDLSRLCHGASRLQRRAVSRDLSLQGKCPVQSGAGFWSMI